MLGIDPDGPVFGAAEFMTARKCAMLNAAEDAPAQCTRTDFAVRSLTSGTDLRPEDVAAFVEGAAIGTLQAISENPAGAIPAAIAGFLLDAFMHGYHARRLQEGS